MDTTGAVIIYNQLLTDLKSKLGELAEVKKAELQAEFDGYTGTNVTEARQNSKFAAITYTQERFDLEADIDYLRAAITFHHLLIENQIAF